MATSLLGLVCHPQARSWYIMQKCVCKNSLF